MKITLRIHILIQILFLITLIAGCNRVRITPEKPNTPPLPQTSTITQNPPVPTKSLSNYAFPASIDPSQRYLFYLHGKIIEDQGIPAISPDFGEYQYLPILEKLSSYGCVVISEQRQKNTDVIEYARKIAEQIKTLLQAGVPAVNITVVGASKGAYIAIYTSHLLENEEVNYVVMGSCDSVTVKELIQNNIILYGNVLTISDSADTFAGSCKDLFEFSEGKGIARHDEIILNVGSGHGILYKPMDEWIKPTIEWARKTVVQ